MRRPEAALAHVLAGAQVPPWERRGTQAGGSPKSKQKGSRGPSLTPHKDLEKTLDLQVPVPPLRWGYQLCLMGWGSNGQGSRLGQLQAEHLDLLWEAASPLWAPL